MKTAASLIEPAVLASVTKVPVCEVCGKEMQYEERASPFGGGKPWRFRKWDGHEACKLELERQKDRAEEDEYKQRIAERGQKLITEAFRLTTLNPDKRRLEDFKRDEINGRALDLALEWKHPAQGFLLYGLPGSGKTHLLCGLVRRVCLEQGTDCLVVQVRPWLDTVLQAPFAEAQAMLEAAVQASLLVLDDLGAGSLTEAADERLQRVLDARLEFDKPTFASTNLTGAELKKTLSPRTLSRALGLMKPVELSGADRRRR